MKTLIVPTALSLLVTAAASAQESDPDADAANQAIIDAYMAAYDAADFDAMAPFMADNVVFTDPTAVGMGETGLLHHGRDDIMAALRDFDARFNPIALNFDWQTTYESNDRYVFVGTVNATYPVEQDGMVFRWSAPQTTVIHLRNGLVVEQYDFVNYEGAEQGIVAAE